MEKLGFIHATPNETGAPSYDPKDLTKLYLYGALNHVRTSRKLERECHRNLEAIWLMKNLTPDHKTIANFRKDNAHVIKAVFKEFVQFCKNLDLYGAELIALDGSKFIAQNSKDKACTQKGLTKYIKVIEESTQRYLEELDAADNEEENQTSPLWENKVKAILAKKEECEKLLRKMKETGQTEVELTDPECRLMKNRDKIEPCYNVHTAVDAKNHLIVEYDVTNAPNDTHALSSLSKSAKEALGSEAYWGDCGQWFL